MNPPPKLSLNGLQSFGSIHLVCLFEVCRMTMVHNTPESIMFQRTVEDAAADLHHGYGTVTFIAVPRASHPGKLSGIAIRIVGDWVTADGHDNYIGITLNTFSDFSSALSVWNNFLFNLGVPTIEWCNKQVTA